MSTNSSHLKLTTANGDSSGRTIRVPHFGQNLIEVSGVAVPQRTQALVAVLI